MARRWICLCEVLRSEQFLSHSLHYLNHGLPADIRELITLPPKMSESGSQPPERVDSKESWNSVSKRVVVMCPSAFYRFTSRDEHSDYKHPPSPNCFLFWCAGIKADYVWSEVVDLIHSNERHNEEWNLKNTTYSILYWVEFSKINNKSKNH